MAENEIRELKEWLQDFIRMFGCNFDDLEARSFNEIVTHLEELKQYRTIGLTPELIEAMQGYNVALINDLGEYQAIGTVEEVKMLKDYKELYDVYKLIGTIEEFRNLKYKKNVLPIATIEFSKEDMQKIVDEKVAQIELNIQEIRAKAIDEFAHQFKENLNQEFPSNYESTRPYFSLENARLIVDEIAEQLKAGGKK